MSVLLSEHVLSKLICISQTTDDPEIRVFFSFFSAFEQSNDKTKCNSLNFSICSQGLSDKNGMTKESVDLIDGICLAALVCFICCHISSY